MFVLDQVISMYLPTVQWAEYSQDPDIGKYRPNYQVLTEEWAHWKVHNDAQN